MTKDAADAIKYPVKFTEQMYNEIKLQTLQDLFLDISKKVPLTDETGKFVGVKELTLNDVKKIILNKIKELENE